MCSMTHAVTETLGQEQMLCSEASTCGPHVWKHNGNIMPCPTQQSNKDEGTQRLINMLGCHLLLLAVEAAWGWWGW